jgi:hypothetical protein
MPGGSSERLLVGLRDVILLGDPVGTGNCKAEGCVATDLPTVINQFVTRRYFSVDPDVQSRILILFTDGETRETDVPKLAAAIQEQGIHILLVQISHPDDRVYNSTGEENSLYVPSADGRGKLDALAGKLPNTEVFTEEEIAGAISRVGELLGDPTELGLETQVTKPVFLGPWVAVAAILTLIVGIGATLMQLLAQRMTRLKRR